MKKTQKQEKHIEIKKADKLAKVMSVAGVGPRLKILCLLFKEKKLCVSEIALKTEMSVATASHHLQVLSSNKLLSKVREGKNICYMYEEHEFARGLKKFICHYL